MSAAAKPTIQPPNMTADGTFTQHPSDVLIDLVADLLAPMFLGAASGDYRYARLAAMETVWSYKAATQADLLQVIQIVAYGLAAVLYPLRLDDRGGFGSHAPPPQPQC